jgi:hypothetical protein
MVIMMVDSRHIDAARQAIINDASNENLKRLGEILFEKYFEHLKEDLQPLSRRIDHHQMFTILQSFLDHTKLKIRRELY